MEAPKEFGKVVISLENSILPLEVLENTPSRREGIPESLENDLRMVGCDYIQSAGILLKLPQVAMATAQVLFHRFYYAKSFIKYNVQYMAAACIFTATKVEEAPRRLRDVINVFHHLKQKWSCS
jgi:transcription initiation factor TFIIIB Brf1 subunit/transcription initiation factor TFIIB